MTTYKAPTMVNSFFKTTSSPWTYTPPSGRWAKVYVSYYDETANHGLKLYYGKSYQQTYEYPGLTDEDFYKMPKVALLEEGETLYVGTANTFKLYIEEFSSNDFPT